MSPAAFIAAFRRPTRRPAHAVMVLVSGLPVAGKSVFARELAARTGAARLSSDAIRLELSEGSPTYSAAESADVYSVIRRLAVSLLADGHAVIVDATSLYPDGRRLTLGAAQPGIPTILVWATVDEATAAARLAGRQAGRDPHDQSEADAAVRAKLAPLAVPPTPDEAGTVLIMRPDSFAATLRQVAARIGQGLGANR